ncbi:MAG: sulfotransferase domain-containing protein [Rhizomicrobium sp.]
MSGKFVLVASYPKSGNTWTRLVLERLQRGAGQAYSINDLKATYDGIQRRFAFDQWAPVNASELLVPEMEEFLPHVHRCLARGIHGTVLVKVHEIARRNVRGEWLYPPDCMGTVIYLARHPYDVAVSAAHHLGLRLERVVEIMGDDSSRGSRHEGTQTLPQTFGSWSGNVQSWIGNGDYDVTVVRYEDMVADPVRVFSVLARAAGLEASAEDISGIVDSTRFERLQKEEDEAGFRERPETSQRFFRAGHPGTWKGVLNAELRDRLAERHGPTMARLGYAADGSFDAPVGV